MRKENIVFICMLPALFFACSPGSEKDAQQNQFVEKRIEQLLSAMTIEEKVGQMTNIGLTALCKGDFWNTDDTLVIDTLKLRNMLAGHFVGSVQNKGVYPPSADEWHNLIKQIQDFALSETRLGIPVLIGIDAVHGANYTARSTLFPHQIAIAASREPEYARLAGQITSYELRASSIPWNYAPVLDVSWQPLWGRLFETFGEDTFLAAVMGKAFVEGSQGESLSDSLSTAVCLKHFIGYGTPVSGKDRSPALIPEHYLRQYYLEPFKKAIEAGAMTVMLNSGSVNGIPGHIDKYMITTVLKGELGFKGFTISDWDDISKLYLDHRVASGKKEATKMAVLAGLDMCMVPYDASFATDLLELVAEGEVPVSRIDDAVQRILRVKIMLGLFETQYHSPDSYTNFASDEFADVSYRAATEAITLLKNRKSILPLDKSDALLVTGPAANSLNALNGAWSRTWAGEDTSYNDKGKKTISQALSESALWNKVIYSEGCSFDDDVNTQQTVSLAYKSDAVIVCLGEKPATEKPSDIDDLTLPDAQLHLVSELAKTGKPLILVLVQGRPRIISDIVPHVDAVLMAYLPGNEGGRAIADIISGKVNPSGRLPYTYPRHTGSLVTYQHKGTDRVGASFEKDGFNPLFHFSEGMSYTKFDYGQPSVSSDTLLGDNKLWISVNVTNTGDYTGKEVVHLFCQDLYASLSPDMSKLIAFTKIELKPGEKKEVRFKVNRTDLSFVNTDNKWITEEGKFLLRIGGDINNMREMKIVYLDN